EPRPLPEQEGDEDDAIGDDRADDQETAVRGGRRHPRPAPWRRAAERASLDRWIRPAGAKDPGRFRAPHRWVSLVSRITALFSGSRAVLKRLGRPFRRKSLRVR